MFWAILLFDILLERGRFLLLSHFALCYMTFRSVSEGYQINLKIKIRIQNVKVGSCASLWAIWNNGTAPVELLMALGRMTTQYIFNQHPSMFMYQLVHIYINCKYNTSSAYSSSKAPIDSTQRWFLGLIWIFSLSWNFGIIWILSLSLTFG